MRSPLRDLKEGVAYVWTTPRMRAALWVAFLANLTAYPLTNGLLPYVARAIYGTNQTGLGYLSASFAIGSLVGSIVLSLIGGIRVARLMIASTVLWYATLLLFVQMQTHADRDRLPGARRFLAEPRHDLDRRHPDAHGEPRISAAG